MGDYTFSVPEIFAEPYAATPQLTARVRIEESTGQVVHAMALRCQVRIEPQRRGYTKPDEIGLSSLFGNRDRWKDTLRPFLWMQCSTTVQGFTGVTEADLPLPCTYDFEVAGSRFLHAVGEGTIPLCLMFSGTIFLKGGTSGFAVEQIPWDCDARYDLPVSVWQDMMRAHFPNLGWIKLDRDVLDQIADYRTRHGLTSWEETVQHLLASESEALR
ncbi:MAG: DUF6084 family protein [Marmoricola sp.]